MTLLAALSGIRAVVFDVGETLVDESAAWAEAAESAGVTFLTLAGVLGALIERGEDHRRVWQLLGVPEPARPPTVRAADLYPDALPCLQAARGAGLVVGIAGNQPSGVEAQLRAVGAGADFTASSAAWGVEKPSAAFFDRVGDCVGTPPGSIAYVGDRLDNDVLPARAAGLRTILIRRGPWGHLHAGRSDALLADACVDSLAEITAVLQHGA